MPVNELSSGQENGGGSGTDPFADATAPGRTAIPADCSGWGVT